MVAGASRIKFKDYLFGTALGMTPGILTITVFADRLIVTLRDPYWGNIAILLIMIIVFSIAIWWAKKRITRDKVN
jgi:uncharacterized membrane protein YdjX (TVP38/TMEM64 family)